MTALPLAALLCPPTIQFRLELETLRAGVGGGGGLTDGGFGGATVGRPVKRNSFVIYKFFIFILVFSTYQLVDLVLDACHCC